MPYRFGADESVRRAILRCSREQRDRAAFELSDGIGTDPVTAVHTARKAIKKQRSLLRLAAAGAFETMRAHFEARRSAERGPGDASDVDERAVQELAGVRTRVDRWELGAGGWKTLESGLLRSYRRGRRTFARARIGGEMEDRLDRLSDLLTAPGGAGRGDAVTVQSRA
jgi:hypothetical protein